MRNARFFLIFLFLAIAAGTQAARVEVGSPSPQAEFAAEEIKSALKAQKETSDRTIRLEVAPNGAKMGIKPEGFAIRVEGNAVRVLGADAAGLMYGGFEVAEIVRTRGLDAVRDDKQNPYMAKRGTKFNCPLDLRTPSYTDPCDAAQINIPEMWSFDFWKTYIDCLAQYRYNFISLWSLHPFPSMVKVPGYEKIALDDVWRSKNISGQETYSLSTVYPLDERIMKDVEVVKKISIDEKIEFWRKVMAYGKSRNVDFHVVTWNIFDHGTFNQYGVDDKWDNPITVDYFRKSVKQMFVTYPDLAGIGLTTGENMPGLSSAKKEEWAFATYGQGALDAAKEMPDRKITFIHRQHQTGAKDIAKQFQPLVDNPNIEFIFSFKYAKAHVMSAVEQPYHESFVKDISVNDMRTIWTLRNDSNYHFRWGAPDFVRTFISGIPYEVSRGYYYGSDGFVWGRNFLERRAQGERDVEVRRHWFHWMLWGRLGYDPELSNERLGDILAERFGLGTQDAARLLGAWQNASMVYPTVTGFHWGSLDFQWFIEGCQSQAGYAQNKTGFHDVNRFISLPPHARSGCQSIPDYVKMTKSGGSTKLQSPFDVADDLDKITSEASKGVDALTPAKNHELKRTLEDIHTMALLGRYYAKKIRGSTEVALFRDTNEEKHQRLAIEHLTGAALAWKAYAEAALKQYKNPLWTNRVGMMDWKVNYGYALDDIRIAGGDPEKLGLPATLDAKQEPIERRW